MRARSAALLLLAAAAAAPTAALAFDRCGAFFATPADLAGDIGATTVARAPVKYHALAAGIKLVTDAPAGTLIPLATEQQGAKIVVVPLPFARVLCRMTLATYLRLEGVQPADFDQASRAAARCVDAGRPRSACLEEFAAELEKRYRAAFAALPAQEKAVAYNLYLSALDQIAMHEYAHHFLDHSSRIRSKRISRIDAEFEADLFAILNGVQAGDAVSSMYYFFDGLADMESHTQKLATPDYESGSCRANNVENITGFIGIAPIMLLDAAYGGGYRLRRNSPEQMRSLAKEQFSGAAPALKPGACALVAKVALGDAFQELRGLFLRVSSDADFLFAAGASLDVERANRLLGDLSAMSERYRYMNGVAAKSMALMLRKWGLKGRALTPLVGSVDRILATPAVTDSFMSEDYGRLLQAQGLAVLQERVDLPARPRADRSYALLERAVFYNPAQSEAWMNLAFIAFKRGDCAAAAGFADRAVATLAPSAKDAREGSVFFARKMREFASSPASCAAEGAKFHPYEGL